MLSLIAGLKWADRYDLSRADRNRVVLVMHLVDRSVGPAAALLLGKRQVERLAPPPSEPEVRPRGGQDGGPTGDGTDSDGGGQATGSAPPDRGAGSGKPKKKQ